MISSPPKSAVALTYDSRDGAPRVVAKGRGELAETILRSAQEHGVYVHQSADLVALLMQVDLDEQIPSALYVAVAELLAWLHTLEHAGATATEAVPRPDLLTKLSE